MPREVRPDAASVVAYQDVTLVELHALLDEMDFDLGAVVERERRIAQGLDEVDLKINALGGTLRALGVAELPSAPVESRDDAALSDTPRAARYAVPTVPASEAFGEIVALAKERLGQLGIDLSRDPLLQVLPSSEIAQSLRRYSDVYGEISWDEADLAVVATAGLVATLLDIILVRVPEDSAFLGRDQTGSPLTQWLVEHSGGIHKCFLEPLEPEAIVPYDASTTSATGGLVSGMRPATHRLQSPGHDPLTGFLIGVADLMRGTGTYIDKTGDIVQVASVVDPVDLNVALLTYVRHLLSDVATPAGLPPPLFTMLQVGQVASPFALGPSGVKVPWTDVARYMYVHGYDLRHFFVMGITPAVVEAIIRGYWMLNGFALGREPGVRPQDRAKLASMLLFGHTIALSGTLLKTGVVYGMNPASLNWAQFLAMAPAAVAWVHEAAARDARVSGGLDAEWRRLLAASEDLSHEPNTGG